MLFGCQMKDIVPKEKPLAHDDNLQWYLEELLLCYKYNYKSRFFQALEAIKPYLSRQVYLMFKYIGENRYSW